MTLTQADGGFRPAEPESGTLSLWLSPDVICSFSAASGAAVVAKSLATDQSLPVLANIKAALSSFGIDAPASGKVNAVHCSPRMTVVPSSLYDSAEANALFGACFDIASNEEVLSASLPNAGCVALFGFNRYVRRFFASEFPQASFHNSFALLLEHAAASVAGSNERVAYAYVYNGSMGVFAFDCGRLVFSNTFECNDDNTRLFYLLHAWRAVGFSQTDDLLHVSVEHGAHSSLARTASRYVSNVVADEPAGTSFKVEGDAVCLTSDMAALLLSESNVTE